MSLFDRSRAYFAAFLVPLLLSSTSVQAQRPPEQPDAARILHEMQKLNVLGSVLYIAAHPDDENTRLIAWLANGKKVRTGYLSLTRGEGGQNLIGPELGDALGIIRTQELLEARRIDGGEQFFTRAVDFGYSKSAVESFEKWGKQEVLSDVVRVIRTFQPDIIITRFAPDRSAGHGHHEASAILAAEAFDLAGDPKAFPEQLQQGLEVWQPRRLFFNGSTFWKPDLAEYVKKDTASDWYSVDVGGYDPLLGLSYTEIAGRSRSMHKSQGFGAAETRGEMIEYLRLDKGDKPKSKDIFEGIDMTWGRFGSGASMIKDRIAHCIDRFDPMFPDSSIKDVESIRGAMISRITFMLKPGERPTALQADELDRLKTKLQAIESLLRSCAGLVFDVLADRPFRTTWPDVRENRIHVSVLARRGLERDLMIANWERFARRKGWARFDTTFTLTTHIHVSPNDTTGLPPELDQTYEPPIDQPYWLARAHTGMYSIELMEYWHGEAVQPSIAAVNVDLSNGYSDVVASRVPVMYKWVDRVAGERIRPVYVTPVASVIPKDNVLITRGGPLTITVEVEALTDSLSGYMNVTPPEGWITTKDLKVVNIARRNERQSLHIKLTPLPNAAGGVVKFSFSGPKGTADRTLHEIDYPHILPQVYYTPAEVKLVVLELETNTGTVGYIKGAGDEVPQAIERLGVEVEIIDPTMATLESLRKYDAIVTGIRAYNTNKALKDLNPVLMEYMKEGGTLVVQYNTLSRDMVLPDSLFGPYPFKLTRDRVTVEEATCKLLATDHPLLNYPNKIDPSDFNDWTQERGLYFCGSLDPRYTPLLSWSDPGEDPLNGALITCDYGKGRYVYTGISFFRQLPAGVPGAYRLFANLISRRAQ